MQDKSLEHMDLLQSAEERIKQAFPLLSQLCISERFEAPAVPIPFFVALIAAIAESSKRPCCVILPEKKGVAATVSLLLALHRFKCDTPDILRRYASISFKPGEQVLVNPLGLVYEYGGFFTPELFRLKVLDRNESRSLHVSEVARLEKTTRRRPKGYIGSDLGVPNPTLLGTVIDIKGSVNRNLLQNYVAILSSKKVIEEQLRNWRIGAQTNGNELGGSFEEVIPAGEITDNGGLKFLDSYVPKEGAPLVAITSRPEDLATYCAHTSSFTKLVVVDEIERLTRNFQAYDTIADSQPMLIISDATEHMAISDLYMRGCQVWDMTANEILAGVDSAYQNDPFGNIFRKAANRQELVVASLSCSSAPLEKAAEAIRSISRSLPRESENSLVRDLFFSLFGTIMSSAEFLGQPASDFNRVMSMRIEQANGLMHNAAPWIPSGLTTQLQSSISELSDALDLLFIDSLTPKGDLLLKCLTQSRGDGVNVALATPTDKRRDELLKWLTVQKQIVPVYLFSELTENPKIDTVILTAWPNAKRFDALMRLYAAKRIEILGYSFERKWLHDYQHSFASENVSSLKEKRKIALLSMLPAAESSEDGQEENEPEQINPFQLPEERFLTRRKTISSEGDYAANGGAQCEAYYVDFAGSSFAYITDGHELSIVSKFVGDCGVTSAAVKNSPLKEVSVGDYILFRKSGDSDILRFIAEDLVGASQYKAMRDKATSWRAALECLGHTPREIWQKLHSAGFVCHKWNVRNWVTDQHMIAPKNFDSVRMIAQAARDDELMASLSEVEKAVDQTKSLHIRAGFKLTAMLREALPTGIQADGEREIELDLVFGSVWIVRVTEIDRAATQCSRSLVNRLLWDKSF